MRVLRGCKRREGIKGKERLRIKKVMIENEKVVEGVVESMTSAMAEVLEKDLERADPELRHRSMVQEAYSQFQHKTLTVLPNAAQRFVNWLEQKLLSLKGEAQEARHRQTHFHNSLRDMRHIAERLKGEKGEKGEEGLRTEDLVPISQEIADRVKEIVEGNKELKEEMKQEVKVEMEVKQEELVSLLLRSVKITVQKGGKKYLEQERMSEVKTTDEKELLAMLEEEQRKNEELSKVRRGEWQENEEMRHNRAKEGEEVQGRVQEMREAVREQERKWDAERKTIQAEMEAMRQQIMALQEDTQKKQQEIVSGNGEIRTNACKRRSCWRRRYRTSRGSSRK